MKIYRQGDVLLRKIEGQISGTFEEIKDKIIARGEVTGHSHRIEGLKARVQRNLSNNQLLVELEEPARLIHEEHGMIELEVGNYEVIRQREYNPLENRQVLD